LVCSGWGNFNKAKLIFSAEIHGRNLEVTQDGLEVTLSAFFLVYFCVGAFTTVAFSVLFYVEHPYVYPITTNYWHFNAAIVFSLSWMTFVNWAMTVLAISTAVVYVNSTTIWLKYFTSVLFIISPKLIYTWTASKWVLL